MKPRYWLGGLDGAQVGRDYEAPLPFNGKVAEVTIDLIDGMRERGDRRDPKRDERRRPEAEAAGLIWLEREIRSPSGE